MAMNPPNLQVNSTYVAPTVTSPLALSDVSNVAMYRSRVVKRKFDDPAAISDDDVAKVIIAEHTVRINSILLALLLVFFFMSLHFIQAI